MNERVTGTGDEAGPGRRPETSASDRHPDVLDRLLDVEARLDAMVEGCREEAEELVADARRDAERLLEGVEAEVRAELDERRREILEEGRERAARLRDEAARAARRWRGIAPSDREELAGLAVGRVLRPPSPEAAP